MKTRFEVTEEIMEKASTYIPVMLKEAVAASYAYACVRETRDIWNFAKVLNEETEQFDPTEQDLFGIPPTYCENTQMKSRVLMGVMLTSYLHIKASTDDILCSIDEYDGWAGAHIMNQIERFKTNPKFKSKAFDILSDYKDMERRLNAAIYAVCKDLNDPCSRMIKALSYLSSEEAIENASNIIRESMEGMKAEKEKQDNIIQFAGKEKDVEKDET